MTSQQALIIFLGLILVGLSIHEYWGAEVAALFGPVKKAS